MAHSLARWTDYFRLLRVHHWAKNSLLFVPMIAAHAWLPANFDVLLLAFASFSLTASAAYIVNDLRDLPDDRLHPTKHRRPLASGEISRSHGLPYGSISPRRRTCVCGTGVASVSLLCVPLFRHRTLLHVLPEAQVLCGCRDACGPLHDPRLSGCRRPGHSGFCLAARVFDLPISVLSPGEASCRAEGNA